MAGELLLKGWMGRELESEWTSGLSARVLLPRTLHYCGICEKQTPHAIVGPVETLLCLGCADRASVFELDRD